LRTLAPGLFHFWLILGHGAPVASIARGAIVAAMSKAVRDSEEVAELKQLYDRLALAVERAAATMHIRGAESTAFTVEDTKCVALWDRIRALMHKDR
jgi:hypothetical protein